MKPVFQYEYCNYMGNAEDVESHERQCVKNPDYRCGRRPIKSPQSGYAYCAPIVRRYCQRMSSKSCAKCSEKDNKISWKAW